MLQKAHYGVVEKLCKTSQVNLDELIENQAEIIAAACAILSVQLIQCERTSYPRPAALAAAKSHNPICLRSEHDRRAFFARRRGVLTNGAFSGMMGK